jgi:hypothetical protein
VFCRLHKKVCIDVTVALLEKESQAIAGLGPPGAAIQPERAHS